MIAVLTRAHLAEAVWQMIGPSEGGPVVVVGDPKLATALGQRGAEVIVAGAPRGGFRRARAVAQAEALPVAPGAARAVVGVSAADGWGRQLGEWMRACETGGVVATLGRGDPRELSRRVLLAGLGELAQRRVGRVVITAGVVKRFATS